MPWNNQSNMPPRLYCPSLSSLGPVALIDSEAHHAAHVLRHTVGDAIELFDGKGLIGTAVIAAIRKHAVECQVTELYQAPPPVRNLTLATAVPKGERFDWLVEKATELGVTRLIPLITTRSTVDPRGSKLERLRQTVIAACKQSRRAYLMDLTAPQTWPDFLNEGLAGNLYLAHPGASEISLDSMSQERQLTFAIGPEGGFTEDEIQTAITRGGRLIALGSNILRIETAGIAIAAWSLLQADRHADQPKSK